MKVWQKIIIKIFKFLLPLGLICMVAYLFYCDFNFSGQRIITHSAANPSIVVSGPEPASRIMGVFNERGEKFWSINIDPVYWRLKLPRHYQNLEVIILYEAQGVPSVQLGGLVTEKGWNFDWRGMQNLALENITWPCLIEQDKGWRLCQKEKNYQSIENFLISPPRNKKILNYNFPLSDAFDRLGVEGYNYEVGYEDYDYLIAIYQPPEIEGNWSRQSINFSLDELYLDGNIVQLALSAPGLDDMGKTIKVKEIKFILTKEPITWNNFFPKLLKNIKKIFK